MVPPKVNPTLVVKFYYISSVENKVFRFQRVNKLCLCLPQCFRLAFEKISPICNVDQTHPYITLKTDAKAD